MHQEIKIVENNSISNYDKPRPCGTSNTYNRQNKPSTSTNLPRSAGETFDIESLPGNLSLQGNCPSVGWTYVCV